MVDSNDSDPQVDRMDYESILALAEGDRPVHTLLAEARKNDPFYITPARQRKAEWFAALWRTHCAGRASMHIRGIHYILVSLPVRPQREGSGTAYENTECCFKEMGDASRDARLLGLVPMERITDERNDAPVEHLPYWSDSDSPRISIEEPQSEVEATSLETIEDSTPELIIGEVPVRRLVVVGLNEPPDLIGAPAEIEAPDLPEIDVETRDADDLVPDVTVHPPQVTPPWFHIELWCEKTTMNSILLSIARERRANVITGPGFQSLTGSKGLIERAKRSKRPVRICYISDFDHSGQCMPVAVARQIEFLLQKEGLDLDIKLISVALTHDQCVEYRLPRTPIKDSIGAKAAW
jgi:hypothetical protein